MPRNFNKLYVEFPVRTTEDQWNRIFNNFLKDCQSSTLFADIERASRYEKPSLRERNKDFQRKRTIKKAERNRKEMASEYVGRAVSF